MLSLGQNGHTYKAEFYTPFKLSKKETTASSFDPAADHP